jgi:hypothetical protein
MPTYQWLQQKSFFKKNFQSLDFQCLKGSIKESLHVFWFWSQFCKLVSFIVFVINTHTHTHTHTHTCPIPDQMFQIKSFKETASKYLSIHIWVCIWTKVRENQFRNYITIPSWYVCVVWCGVFSSGIPPYPHNLWYIFCHSDVRLGSLGSCWKGK